MYLNKGILQCPEKVTKYEEEIENEKTHERSFGHEHDVHSGPKPQVLTNSAVWDP